ncbi:uncharacterized protein LOC130993945 [Salvia miltiorrhiza]|uniref:uncharacterized protein LOC130993945 n=1 Tax=Salvia miltiorrhiza TaxID=226208 RepID=UPI0025AD13B9|nr:uncharacterized protein LOC130993945 [Salvia miltiorrhiza]
MGRGKAKDFPLDFGNAIIVQDTDSDQFNSPVKKQTKVVNPRLSCSEKGKSKELMFPIIRGSSSAGAKRNLNNAKLSAVNLKSASNVIDLTKQAGNMVGGRKQGVFRVYKRRTPKLPTLNTRTTPAAFHDALLKLNDAQMSAVRDIGFGSILDLKVKDLPGGLGYWILKKFNPQTFEIEVDAMRRFKVTESDVYRVFGFPRGKQFIEVFQRQSTSDIFEQWFLFFGVDNRDKIKIGVVLKHMLACKSGGTWFKRHFMIAMGFSLFENCPNGTVHPFILGCLKDLTGLRRWNWAEYMLSSLKQHTCSWMKGESSVYAGPALFLILVYVDRLSLPGIETMRDLPLIKNWSSDALRERQRMERKKEYIGKGIIQSPIQVPSVYGDDIDENAITDEEKAWTNMLMKGAHEIAERMNQLSIVVDSAPVHIKKSPFFEMKVKEASQLTGMKIDIVIPITKPVLPVIEIDDDPIEYTAEFFAWVDETSAKACAEKKKVNIRDADIPIFDLRLSDDDSLDVSQNKDVNVQQVFVVYYNKSKYN